MAGCLALALSACGGVDSLTCHGTSLDPSKLCSLSCGSTTQAQAIVILGNPSASVSGLISYSSVCANGDLQAYDLSFDSTTGVLISVSYTGMGKYASGSLPACIASCHL